ncbi:hypothetical protein K438DRAFT_1753926 [Mycena galopus ATCC 62051]|nr:hypothetical protein K438DRAFT_1753926 [Mycena galopus ATCC 62051]
MWTDVPVALGPDLSLCAVSMESFALCKVWEWDLSYECLTSPRIRKRLRDEGSQNTEFWQELQASRARRGLPPGTKFAEDDKAQLDNEEGPDDSDVSVAAVIADVANKRKGRVARKPDSEGGGLRSAGLAEDLEAGAEPAAEDLEADSEAGPGADKEEGRDRKTRKRNRRYLGWLWHDNEDVEEHKVLDDPRCHGAATLFFRHFWPVFELKATFICVAGQYVGWHQNYFYCLLSNLPFKQTRESDIWDFGCICYEIWLEGETPFSHFATDTVLVLAISEFTDSQQEESPYPVKPHDTGGNPMPDRLWELVQCCFRYNLFERPTVDLINHQRTQYRIPQYSTVCTFVSRFCEGKGQAADPVGRILWNSANKKQAWLTGGRTDVELPSLFMHFSGYDTVAWLREYSGFYSNKQVRLKSLVILISNWGGGTSASGPSTLFQVTFSSDVNDVEVQFGSGSAHFLPNADSGIRSGSNISLNLNLNLRSFRFTRFGSQFTGVRTPEPNFLPSTNKLKRISFIKARHNFPGDDVSAAGVSIAAHRKKRSTCAAVELAGHTTVYDAMLNMGWGTYCP